MFLYNNSWVFYVLFDSKIRPYFTEKLIPIQINIRNNTSLLRHSWIIALFITDVCFDKKWWMTRFVSYQAKDRIILSEIFVSLSHLCFGSLFDSPGRWHTNKYSIIPVWKIIFFLKNRLFFSQSWFVKLIMRVFDATN